MKHELILQAKEIKKYYGTEQILDVQEFRVYAGAANFLLGVNGSGKTTLFKILSLVDGEFSGQLMYRGTLVQKEEEVRLELRRRLAVIWQNPYMFEGSVGYNIGLPLELRKVERTVIEASVAKLAADLRIEHLLRKQAKQLSGGEKQKVSIARALITEPELLFVDEPATNLDYESNEFVNKLLARQVQSGMTIVVVTHDLHQIQRLAEYITILQGGRVVANGRREEFDLTGLPKLKGD